MRKRFPFYNFILIIIVFEEFFLKLITNESNFYSYKYISDILVFAISLIVILKNFKINLYFKKILLPSLSLVLIFLISFMNEYYNFFDLMSGIGAFFRFIIMGFAVSLIKIDKKDYIEFISFFKKIVIIEILIGLIQLSGSEFIFSIFQPLQTNTNFGRVANSFENWDGGIWGTFPNTISYGYFLVIYFVITFIHNYYFTRNSFFFSSFVILILVFFTYSVINFIALIFLLLFFYFSRIKQSIYFLNIIIIIIIFIPLSSLIISNLSDYYFVAQGNRLGIILFTFWGFFSNISFNLFVGFGFNYEKLISIIFKQSVIPEIFLNDKSVIALNDVYWIALFFYSGILGVSIIIIILKNIFSETKKKKCEIAEITKILLFLLILFNFVNQAFVVKIFSYFFWLYTGFLFNSNFYKLEKNLSNN